MHRMRVAAELAPPAPPCFVRLQWLEYVAGAASVKGTGGTLDPLLVENGVSRFNPAFDFCQDCTPEHRQTQVRANKCKPQHVRELTEQADAPWASNPAAASRDSAHSMPMSAKETVRYEFRVALFSRRGWPQERAVPFAIRLRDRDAEGDERRACIECKHLQRPGTCFLAQQGRLQGITERRYQPVTDVLQRCDGFDFQKP